VTEIHFAELSPLPSELEMKFHGCLQHLLFCVGSQGFDLTLKSETSEAQLILDEVAIAVALSELANLASI
jgi:hypothetical protein